MSDQTTEAGTNSNGSAGKSNKAGWGCWWFFILVIVVGGLLWFNLELDPKKVIERVAGFFNKVPCFIALAMLAVLWCVYRWWTENASLLDLIRGKDNKYSISKGQFLLWTVLVFFSYVSIFAALAGKHLLWKFITGVIHGGLVDLPSNLLLAMGLSVTTVLAAKGITVDQISSGTVAKDPVNPNEAKYGDLLKDDDGVIDLSKVQMMGWTMIGLATYLTSVMRMVHHIGTDTIQVVNGKISLPDIDATLMVLMGLGQGTYLVKKMITTATPAISGIKGCAPGTALLGGELEISGSGFGNEKSGSMITLNGMNTNFQISTWSATSIKLLLSDGALQLLPGQVNLCVVVSNQQSNTVVLKVVRAAKISGVVPEGDGLRVEGSGLGTLQPKTDSRVADGIRLNGKPVELSSSDWSDSAIMLHKLDAEVVKKGAKVKIALIVDGETLPEVEFAVP